MDSEWLIYLSKSKVQQLWKNLKPLIGNKLKLSSIETKLSISLKPELALGGKWDRHDMEMMTWPPWDYNFLIEAIDQYIEKRKVGIGIDVVSSDIKYDYYALQGILLAKNRKAVKSKTEDLFKINVLDTILKMDNGNELNLPVSFENLSGLSQREGRWHIDSSIVYMVFDDIYSEGFPIKGIFTKEGISVDGCTKVSAFYFKSNKAGI